MLYVDGQVLLLTILLDVYSGYFSTVFSFSLVLSSTSKQKRTSFSNQRSTSHRFRPQGGDGGDCPHSQKVVGAMPPKSPHKNFVMSPLYTAKRYSKNYEWHYETEKGAQISA